MATTNGAVSFLAEALAVELAPLRGQRALARHRRLRRLGCDGSR
jgi:hypothetical protein